MSFKSFLNQHVELDNRSIWLLASLYGSAVYLILALMQPFGIDSLGLSKYLILIPFAAVTMAALVSAHYLLRLFRRDFFDPQSWNRRRDIAYNALAIFLIIAGNNAVFIVYWGANTHVLLAACWQTLVIEVCVIAFQQITRIHVISRTTNSQSSADNQSAVVQPLSLTLLGSGKNDTLTLATADLLYVESDKNYCNVVTADSRTQMRLTISSAEEQLSSIPSFMRCHRAYIVNMDKVIGMEGNAAVGYKLKLLSSDLSVPVGRSYNEKIMTVLSR